MRKSRDEKMARRASSRPRSVCVAHGGLARGYVADTGILENIRSMIWYMDGVPGMYQLVLDVYHVHSALRAYVPVG